MKEKYRFKASNKTKQQDKKKYFEIKKKQQEH